MLSSASQRHFRVVALPLTMALMISAVRITTKGNCESYNSTILLQCIERYFAHLVTVSSWRQTTGSSSVVKLVLIAMYIHSRHRKDVMHKLLHTLTRRTEIYGNNLLNITFDNFVSNDKANY